ncbi:MAG: hypothetical protein AB1397_04260 [bacterium]
MIIIFVLPVILVAIGIFFRKHSLKIQKLISFPLIAGCLTIWFLSCFIYIPLNIVKLESKITVILLGLLVSLCGLIFGILISNKILAVKFKLMSFSTIGMFFTVLIGGMIMGSLVGLCFEAGFFNPPIIQKIDAVFPFSALIFVLMACLGGSLGAMLWSKKLKEQVKDYNSKGGQI